MTTLADRPNRALLVVDLQVGVVTGGYQLDTVLATIADLVDRARRADVPVIWVQHHDEQLARDSEPWQWMSGFGPAAGERLVEKSFGDAFADTELEAVLAERSVGDLVLVGAASEQCIRCTLHSAVVRGYDVAVVKGGHTTTDLTDYGLPEPAVVVGFIDALAQFGMQWPGRAGRSVGPADVGF